MATRSTTDDGGAQTDETCDFRQQTSYQRGREQTLWTVHQSPEWEAGPARRKHTVRWTLRVAADGVVSTSRTVPYSGQRYFSTENRPNRADKSSEYRLSVEEVLERHAALCSKRGMAVSVDDLRERVLAVLDRDDVTANNGDTDLLAGDVLDGHDEYGL